MLPPNYHKQPQINISLFFWFPPPSLCIYMYTLSFSLSLLQLPPLPVIFGSGLAPLISGWALWTGERGIVEGGWVLSPAPPCVYLPLPAGLLREQAIERERGRESKRQRDRYTCTKRERERENTGYTGMKTVFSANRAVKRLPVCPLLHWPTWRWGAWKHCGDHDVLSNQRKIHLKNATREIFCRFYKWVDVENNARIQCEGDVMQQRRGQRLKWINREEEQRPGEDYKTDPHASGLTTRNQDLLSSTNRSTVKIKNKTGL